MAKSSVKVKKSEKSEFSYLPLYFSLIFIFTFFSYYSSLSNGFVFDDFSLIKKNPFLNGAKSLKYFFLHFFSIYRPVRTLSYLIDVKIGGMDPFYFHLFNIFFHLLAVFLVYKLLFSLFKDVKFSLIASLIFALHPIHVDAVTYISGRRDVLSAIFTLLSLYFFTKFKESKKLYWWIFILISTILGVFTKEMAFSIPLLIFLIDFTFYNRDGKNILSSIFLTLKRGLYYYLTFLIGGILFLYKFILHGNVSGRTHYWGGNFLRNILTVSKVFMYYIYLLFFPLNLRGDYYYYTFPISFKNGDIMGWISLFAVIFILFSGFYFYKRGNVKLFFLIFFFFISLLPVSHIIPHHELMAEHYLYLPSISFGVLISYIFLKYEKRWFLFVLLLILFLYGIKIYSYSKTYRDDMTFLNYNLKKSPSCIRVNMALGNHYYLEKDYRKAEYFYKKVLELGPIEDREGVKIKFNLLKKGFRAVSNKDFGYFVLASRRLATIYSGEGKFKKAIKVLKDCIRYGLILDTIYNEIGNNFANMGDIKKAIFWYKKSVGVDPENFWSLNNLGTSYAKLGNLDKAIYWFKRALVVNPDDGYVNYNVGLILIAKKRCRDGIFYLKKALSKRELSPDDRKKALKFIEMCKVGKN